MRHLSIKNIQGNLKINKKSVADLVELIRISPIAARILLVLATYADKKNSIITSAKTLGYMLDLKKECVDYGIRKLAKEGFIDLAVVKLNHEQTAELVVHDLDKYFESKYTVWEVISRERASKVDLTGRYFKIVINSAVISGTKDHNNRVLFTVKDNLFFDKDIKDSEILGEMWL